MNAITFFCFIRRAAQSDIIIVIFISRSARYVKSRVTDKLSARLAQSSGVFVFSNLACTFVVGA